MSEPNPTWDLPHTIPEAHPPREPAAGRFRLVRELARGGMGVVYRAEDPAIGREVAVKLLHERLRRDPAAAARFVAEARVTGQLQHPGVPPVIEVGVLPDGSPYLAMKLVGGRTLAELLADRPDAAHDLPRFVGVFEQVCQAVAFAHSRGVVHRDLKPSNVMVGAFGEVQVMDWGLAKARPSPERERRVHAPPVAHARGSDGDVTAAGAVLGTPAYMAPEQACGEEVDCRADVFALGAVLAELLTGRRPYGDGPPPVILHRAAEAMLDDCRAGLGACGADAELVALCTRCLSADPSGRPAHAGEVAELIAAYRVGVEDRLRKAEAERAAAEAKAVEQRKRWRVQLALAAAVGLMLLGGGAVAWWRDREATRKRIEDERREQAERDRVGRNAEAIEVWVGACETALRADDARAAETALAEIDRRAPGGGGDDFRLRIDRCRADLAMLQALEGSDSQEWRIEGGNHRPWDGSPFWSAAFRSYGIVPGETPPAEAARMIRASVIRERLLMNLDLWYAKSPSPALLVILSAADPDPYRTSVRTARGLRRDLVRGPAGMDEALKQPARFAVPLGRQTAIPWQRRVAILQAAHRDQPNHFSLLMTLGNCYRDGPKEGAREQVGWYRAALAVRGTDPTAWNHVGVTLLDLNEWDAAADCFEHVIRLSRGFALGHNNLGVVWSRRKEQHQAMACYREALRCDPNEVRAHFNLGVARSDLGDTDGAIRYYEEAIRVFPKYAPAHLNLGNALVDKGDVEGGIRCYWEAVRLDPNDAVARAKLNDALRMKGEVRATPPPREINRP
jgi:tetratricopeptide (TPR) repeat protein